MPPHGNMLQEGLFYGKINVLGPNLAQEPSGIRFLVQHEEFSEMSWMGLASPRASTGKSGFGLGAA